MSGFDSDAGLVRLSELLCYLVAYCALSSSDDVVADAIKSFLAVVACDVAYDRLFPKHSDGDPAPDSGDGTSGRGICSVINCKGGPFYGYSDYDCESIHDYTFR